MNRSATIVIALIILSSLVLAQKPEKKKPAPKAKPKLEAPLRDESPSGHVAVEVILKNGATFNGVAVKDRMVEKCVRHQYRKIAKEKKGSFGSGIRVWYYDDLIGFLFLPYRQIESVEVGAEYTVHDLERLKDEIKERVRKKNEARLAAKRKAEAEKSKETEVTEVHPLLKEYPPSEGFTAARYEEIQRKAVVEGYEPTAKEKAWGEVFPDWLAASKAEEAKKTEKKAAEKKGASPKVETKKDGTIGVKVPQKKRESSGGDSPVRGLN